MDRTTSNLGDYEQACRTFSWAAARAELSGLPEGGLNIAYEAVDRHVAQGHGGKVAVRWLPRGGGRKDFTYSQLADLTSRFANLLGELGVKQGDAVFALLGRVPELLVTALGTLKAGAVFCPLFSAFGPEPIKTRLEIGEGTVLITSTPLYRRKIALIRDQLPKLRHILLVDPSHPDLPGTDDYLRRIELASPKFTLPRTEPQQRALLHFTSGTTGRPKGAIHVHEAVVAHHATGTLALDLRPGDVFWCTADPGWVTGTSYGIISPLTHGVTLILDEDEFDAERWYETLRRERVTVWYTAPTAIRMLMKAGDALARAADLSSVRLIASVGEPLNAEAVLWGRRVLGKDLLDNWWQTETGGIMISNFPSMELRPGSMGRPMPGVEAGVVHRREGGGVDVVTRPDEEGELALRPGWPSMFRGYLHEEERYRRSFAGSWYLTGDLVRRDADGYFWFIGRADDMIKSSGHLIGPFEVESALLEHPAVAEAGVIGKPDPVAGEVVKAFVTLRSGYSPSDALMKEVLGFARTRLGAVVAPKELAFVTTLPRTRSGKIMRRLLRARELGLPEGDTSTLEAP